MPLSDAQLKQRLVQGLAQDSLQKFIWADLVSSVQATDAAQKAELVNAIRSQRPEIVGKELFKMIRNYLVSEADTQITAELGDGSVTVDNLKEWL